MSLTKNLKENKLVAIVIPIYKSDFSELELISLKQAQKVFTKYDIFFVMPEELEMKIECRGEIKYFPKEFFLSVNTYNRLMLIPEFYQCFNEYQYLLIYQTDAFVFSDCLEQFCSLEYDYIGAPWLSGIWHYLDEQHCIWHVGNGGFSLRKVSSFVRLLNKEKENVKEYMSNEDLFFSMSNCEYFKVAPINVALTFAFERQVRKCFELNKQNLPFGCHAWERYDVAFWKPYIEQNGYKIKTENENWGNEDEQLLEEYEQKERISLFWQHNYNKSILPEMLKNLFGKSAVAYAIWGAGFYGKQTRKMFLDSGLEICCIIDNNVNTQHKQVNGTVIKSFDEYRIECEKAPIIISIGKRAYEVGEQLNEVGYLHKRDYIFLSDILRGFPDTFLYNRE